MSDTCTTCGQGLDVTAHDHAQPELANNNDSADNSSADNSVIATRPFARRLLPVALVAAVLAGALLWLALGFRGETDGEAGDDFGLIDDETAEEISLTDVETRETTATSGASGIVSYLSNDGLVLLNLESGEATIFARQVEPVGFTGRLLLASDGEKSYQVDSQNPRALGTLSAFGTAAPTNISRIVHVMFEPSATPGRRNAMIMSLDGGLIGEPSPVPLGSRIETIDHYGLVLIPPTGGTYSFTRDGPEQISSNRVVAVARDLRIEVQCDDELVCSPYLVDTADGEGGSTKVVPNISGRSEISLSPDGSYVLAAHEGRLVGLRTFDLSAMALGAVEADGKAAWAADSSQFAWLSNSGRVLTIAQPGGGEVARFDLRAIGLPAASHSTVVVSG